MVKILFKLLNSLLLDMFIEYPFLKKRQVMKLLKILTWEKFYGSFYQLSADKSKI